MLPLLAGTLVAQEETKLIADGATLTKMALEYKITDGPASNALAMSGNSFLGQIRGQYLILLTFQSFRFRSLVETEVYCQSCQTLVMI
jgi:hypothetical protein